MNVGTNENWATSSGEVVSMRTPADPQVVDTLDMGEPELEGIQGLLLSSFLWGSRVWCQGCLSFQLSFMILLNGLAYINLFAVMAANESWHRQRGINGESVDQLNTKWNLMSVAIMSFVDSIVLYRASVCMDKEVGLLEAKEAESNLTPTSTSTPSMHFIHAKASRKMDVLLSRGKHRPTVSLFVNLLYLATVLALATSLVCFALRVFVGTSKADGICFTDRYGHEAESTTPSVDGVPDDLQDFLKNVERGSLSGYNTLNYAHMVDGTTYFVGRNASSTSVTHNYNDDSIMHDNIPTLLAAGPDGSIRSISDVLNPKWFTIVAGESALAAEVFCCLYTPSTFPSDHAHNGELWILVQVDRREGRRRLHAYLSDSIEFYKLHPKTMQVTLIANITLSNHNRHPFVLGETNTCFRWAVAIGCVVGAAVLAPASIWMLKVRKMSAGVVPVCIGLIAPIALLSEDLAEGIAFLMVVALTISLLGTAYPLTRREVLVWALYSTLAVLFAMHIGEAGSIGVLILCGVVGLVLDHPVLQFVGWLAGFVSLFIGMGNPIAIPIGIVVSCGLVSVGYTLTKYRPYLVHSTRRLWRLMIRSIENMAGQQPHDDDTV